ncbi:hypothetical protein QTP70_007552 [Hemibagrus guttatus]|uniref:Uncharacterized protein n=1 Tax=Hemibagrus guttatus TaxID=175788 RepID=A0AAE0QMV6_9TELE|nr:hypothetical protein QTP70_007552 [Hemibagrus guttatus]
MLAYKAYKAKNGPAPSYLKALVTPCTTPHSLRSANTARLVPSSLRVKANSNTSASAPGTYFAISPDLDEDIMLSSSDSEELDEGNKEKTAFELPPHSVVFVKFLEVITCAVAKLSLVWHDEG